MYLPTLICLTMVLAAMLMQPAPVRQAIRARR